MTNFGACSLLADDAAVTLNGGATITLIAGKMEFRFKEILPTLVSLPKLMNVILTSYRGANCISVFYGDTCKVKFKKVPDRNDGRLGES